MTSYKSDSFELYCADSYEFLLENEDNLEFDSCITDPPYVINTKGGRNSGLSRSYVKGVEDADMANGFDYIVFDVLKRAQSVMIFCHNDQLENLLPMREVLEFERMVLLEWHKENPIPVANKHYVPDTEFIVHFWRSGGHPKGQLCEKSRYITTPSGKTIFILLMIAEKGKSTPPLSLKALCNG